MQFKLKTNYVDKLTNTIYKTIETGNYGNLLDLMDYVNQNIKSADYVLSNWADLYDHEIESIIDNINNLQYQIILNDNINVTPIIEDTLHDCHRVFKQLQKDNYYKNGKQ